MTNESLKTFIFVYHMHTYKIVTSMLDISCLCKFMPIFISIKTFQLVFLVISNTLCTEEVVDFDSYLVSLNHKYLKTLEN